MVTKHPRLNVVLESELYDEIQKMAEKKGVSLSLMARDLLKEAIERYEDAYWEKVAKQRDKSFSKKSALAHRDVWP